MEAKQRVRSLDEDLSELAHVFEAAEWKGLCRISMRAENMSDALRLLLALKDEGLLCISSCVTPLHLGGALRNAVSRRARVCKRGRIHRALSISSLPGFQKFALIFLLNAARLSKRIELSFSPSLTRTCLRKRLRIRPSTRGGGNAPSELATHLLYLYVSHSRR